MRARSSAASGSAAPRTVTVCGVCQSAAVKLSAAGCTVTAAPSRTGADRSAASPTCGRSAATVRSTVTSAVGCEVSTTV